MGLRGTLTNAFVVIIVGLLVLGTVAAGGPGIVDARTDAVYPQGDDAAALAAAEPTPIASCRTITEPGEYVLTQDIAANGSANVCLRIDVNETVVIDGQGHSIEGGIDAGVDIDEEDTVTLELSDATVDTIRYPEGGNVGPTAAGRLENVTVETIELDNANGLTIESSRVTDEIEGLFTRNITLRNSTFEGRMIFHEDAREWEIVNNSFAERVFFSEHPRNMYIAGNTFQSSLDFSQSGGSPENITVENNHLTVAADEANDIEAGGITVADGGSNVIRNNTIVVVRDEGDDVTEANGIFISGSRNVIQGNTISGADYGIHLYGSGNNRIVDNTITDNRVGIRLGGSSDRVTDNTITDNRVGVEVVELPWVDDAQATFERNVLANNTEFGVNNSVPGEFVFDARNNYWGAADGPSSAPANDSDAPFADPVTSTLANGSGDGVSEGETAGVSNVRFDPFMTAPANETDDKERFYQVDFVAGDVIQTFGPADSDQFYSDQGRLIRFLHGSTSTPVERVSTPPTLSTNIASCVEVESFEVSGDVATVRYTVADGCTLDVTLVSYEKPGSGWSRATASEQRLVDAEEAQATEPGTYELTVSLPTNTTATETNEALSAN